MSYTLTVAAGRKNVVMPNGIRYSAGAVVVLSDDEYSTLSVAAVKSLAAATPLGGTSRYAVTVAPGLRNVVLPDGSRHKGGDVVTLSDEQYSLLTPHAVSTLLSSVQVSVG